MARKRVKHSKHCTAMLINVFICSVLAVVVAAAPTLLLNMLVRDEAVHLARTLPLWAPLIDAWAVCLFSALVYYQLMKCVVSLFYFLFSSLKFISMYID